MMIKPIEGAGGSQTDEVDFSISQRRVDEHTCIVSVAGDLDLATAPKLKWALVDQVAAGASKLVVDLFNVPFIDSTAVSVLVGTRRSLAGAGELAIATDQPNVLQIFEVTGLDAAFEIFPTIEAALAHLQADGE